MEDTAGFIQERDEEGPFHPRDGWKTVVFLVGDDEEAPPAAEGGAGERGGGA